MLAPSAMSATTLTADQVPANRERATAWSPSSRTSATVDGANSGTIRLRAMDSQELGMVEDLQVGSSPIQATAPPRGEVPE